MESVRALDYRLDRNARNLSTKSSGLAGVVARGLTEPWAGAFVAGLERALSNSGYDVILKSTDGAAVRAKRAAEALDGLGAEGVNLVRRGEFPGRALDAGALLRFHARGLSLARDGGGRRAVVRDGRARGEAPAEKSSRASRFRGKGAAAQGPRKKED